MYEFIKEQEEFRLKQESADRRALAKKHATSESHHLESAIAAKFCVGCNEYLQDCECKKAQTDTQTTSSVRNRALSESIINAMDNSRLNNTRITRPVDSVSPSCSSGIYIGDYMKGYEDGQALAYGKGYHAGYRAALEQMAAVKTSAKKSEEPVKKVVRVHFKMEDDIFLKDHGPSVSSKEESAADKLLNRYK